MDTGSPPTDPLEHFRTITRVEYYTPIQAFQIEERDWQRWMRRLRSVPKRKTLLRDFALGALGVSVPSLINGVILKPWSTSTPTWDIVINFGVAIIGFIAGGVCLHLDNRVKDTASSSIESIIDDMRDVHRDAPRFKETSVSPAESTEKQPIFYDRFDSWSGWQKYGDGIVLTHRIGLGLETIA